MRLLLSAACAATLVVVGPRSPALVATVSGTRAPFPEALAAFLSLALAAVAAWTLLVLGLTCLGETGRRLALALTPRLVRGTLLVATSAALTAAPAVAGDTLDGLRLPERVTSEPRDAVPSSGHDPAPDRPPVHDAAPRHRSGGGDMVRVGPGDTLWGLVGRRLGSTDPARVAPEVVRWHTANRAVIGSDPDVLRPGQRLQVPEGSR